MKRREYTKEELKEMMDAVEKKKLEVDKEVDELVDLILENGEGKSLKQVFEDLGMIDDIQDDLEYKIKYRN